MTAEEAEIGADLVWPAAPRVRPALGSLPFAAPSNVGKVAGHENGSALVVFRYMTPMGLPRYSPPIEVLPGQQCEKAESSLDAGR